MYTIICTFTLYALLLQSSVVQGKEKVIKKRQIYREQVLPHAGGKIPDTAFLTDRLFLNRLQKEGFSIPDGVILEQRNPQVHPYTSRVSRPVYRVEATRDGRYIPVEGRYIYRIPPGIETTYLYPQVHNQPLRFPSERPVVPQLRPLLLPSPYATDNLKSLAVSNRNKNTVYVYTVDPKKSYKTVSNSPNAIINFNNNLGRSYLPPSQDIIAPTIFSQFDNLFGGYTLRVTRNADGLVKSTLDSRSSPNLNSGSVVNTNPNLSTVPIMNVNMKGS